MDHQVPVEAAVVESSAPPQQVTSEFADTVVVKEFRVSGQTNSKVLAGSIASHVQRGEHLVLSVIGHQAIGQAIKAIPIANGIVAPAGFQLAIVPSFEVRHLPGDGERTALRLQVVRIALR